MRRRNGRSSSSSSVVSSVPSKTHLPGGRPHQLQDGTAKRRLAAAAFADQPERFAAMDVEIDAVDRVHRADLPASEQTAQNRKMHCELVAT